MARIDDSSFSLKVHHFGVSVANMEESVAWYRDMLGFAVAKREEFKALRGKVVFMKKGDFYVELFEIEDAAPLPEDRRYPDRDLKTHGMKHITFVVADPAAVMAYLKEKGVDVAMESERANFIRDNTGNLIELVSPAAP